MSVSWWIGICLATAGVFTLVGILVAMGALYCNRWVRGKGGYGALTQRLLGVRSQELPTEVSPPAVEVDKEAPKGGCCVPPPKVSEM